VGDVAKWLSRPENFVALADLPGRWIDKVHQRRPPRIVVLDMDSSESPTYGEQEGSAYNGHFGCTCYHPLFVFNQLGDVERCALRPGNAHSADSWRGVLEPVVIRYRGVKHLYFRGDAAFANPEMVRVPRSRGHRLHDPVAGQPDLAGQSRTPAEAPNRAATARGAPVLRQLQLPGAELEEIPPGGGEGRVASRRALSPRRLHRHQSGAAALPCRRSRNGTSCRR
jgi:hypothetical protein